MKTRDILPDLSFSLITEIVRNRRLFAESEFEEDEKLKYQFIGLIVSDEKNFEHTRRYLSDLSDASKKVLMYFASEGGSMEEEDFYRHYDAASQEETAASIRYLRSWGFLYFDPYYQKNFNIRLVGIPEAYLPYIRIPVFLENKFCYYLAKLSPELLQSLQIFVFGELLPCQFKDYILYRFRREISDPAHIQNLVKRLPLLKRKALELTLQYKGRIWLSLLIKKLGMVKSIEVAQRNIVWNHPFIFINHDRKKDCMISIPSDIFFLLKNQPHNNFFTYQASFDFFLGFGAHPQQNKLSNEYQWFLDFAYLVQFSLDSQSDQLLSKGFSKKRDRMILNVDYKGMPFIVFMVLLGSLAKLLKLDGNRFSPTPALKNHTLSAGQLGKILFHVWGDHFFDDELFDKKFLRINKMQLKSKRDVFNLHMIKKELLFLLQAFQPGIPVRIDAFLIFFFDWIKISTYYQSFNYEACLFMNISPEQLQYLHRVLIGPLFWLGIIQIENKEKLDFFFEMVDEGLRTNQTLNQLIKNDQLQKCEAWFMVTHWGYRLIHDLEENLSTSLLPNVLIEGDRISIRKSEFEKKWFVWLQYLRLMDQNEEFFILIPGIRSNKPVHKMRQELSGLSENGEEVLRFLLDQRLENDADS